MPENLKSGSLSALETIDKILLPLQDSEIDLAAINPLVPNHIQCYWQYQPRDLQQSVRILMEQPAWSQTDLVKLYKDYYREIGIDSTALWLGNPQEDQRDVIVVNVRSKPYPLLAVVEACHMFDTWLNLIYTGNERGVVNFSIDATRKQRGSSIYRVNIKTPGVSDQLGHRARFISYIEKYHQFNQLQLRETSYQQAQQFLKALV